MAHSLHVICFNVLPVSLFKSGIFSRYDQSQNEEKDDTVVGIFYLLPELFTLVDLKNLYFYFLLICNVIG